jgi:hypothetical protein
MKKIMVLMVVLTTVFVSCKKERTCACKNMQDFYDLTGAKTSTVKWETENKMTKVGRLEASATCVHKKTSGNYPNTTTKLYDYDEYCELK